MTDINNTSQLTHSDNNTYAGFTKDGLINQLKDMGLVSSDTILIHSSMKAIGNVDGGADTVLDALMEFFSDGLLLLPTHSWKTVNDSNPVFDPASTPSCVGLLTNMFMKRPGVIRSLHPTHSMTGYGKDAAQYLSGEEYCNTPCTPGGCYDRLRERNAKILLIGVGHERNTFIHSVEEVLNIPHRLSDMPMKLHTVMPDGNFRDIYMRKHYNASNPHISEDFVKLEQAFYDCNAARKTVFGSADCILCDAGKIFNVVRHVLAPDPECIITSPVIDKNRWKDLI